MRQITTLNDASKQQFLFSIEGYDAAEVYLEFKPQQLSWFMSITWGTTFSCNNEKVSVSPNILRQFRNLIPFGILITGPDSTDPFTIDAWLNGWSFYILDASDIPDIEALYVR